MMMMMIIVAMLLMVEGKNIPIKIDVQPDDNQPHQPISRIFWNN